MSPHLGNAQFVRGVPLRFGVGQLPHEAGFGAGSEILVNHAFAGGLIEPLGHQPEELLSLFSFLLGEQGSQLLLERLEF